MAALSTSFVTLADLATRLDPNGKIAPVVELQSKMLPLYREMLWKEGNMSTGERTTVRTGLPAPTWRLINKGVVPTTGSTAQIEFKTAVLESRSTVDQLLVDISNDKNEFRLSEAVSHLEGMAQEFESTLFYGTAASPEEFVGLASYYSDPTAGNGQNVIDAGGQDSSDNTSIWFINWGPDCFGLYPQGLPAGMQREDKGLQTIHNFNGTTNEQLDAYVEKFQMAAGVAIRDWRRVVRIGSIDVSNLVAQSSDADLIFYMTKAVHRLRRSMGTGSTAIYMNPTVAEFLDHQRQNKLTAGGGVTMQNIDGEDVLSFRGIPIRISDSILNTEAPV